MPTAWNYAKLPIFPIAYNNPIRLRINAVLISLETQARHMRVSERPTQTKF